MNNKKTDSKKKKEESKKGRPVIQRSPYIQKKKELEIASKQAIARHIIKSNYVIDFDAVLLDSGSTAEEIAGEMFRVRRYLTVLTNNMGAYMSYTRTLQVATEPGFQNELLLTGGRYDPSYEALHGDAAVTAIDKFSPNVTIIAVSGLRENEGLFCHGSEEVRIKELMCKKHTDRRVIAADWTKLSKRDAYAFQPRIEELKNNSDTAILVTTYPTGLSGEEKRRLDTQIEKIKNCGIKVDSLPIKIP